MGRFHNPVASVLLNFPKNRAKFPTPSNSCIRELNVRFVAEADTHRLSSWKIFLRYFWNYSRPHRSNLYTKTGGILKAWVQEKRS